MEEKKKLAILIVSLSFGGAERVVSILLKELKDHFKVTLVLLEKRIQYPIPEGQEIHVLGKKDIYSSNVKKMYRLYSYSKAYAKLCKELQIDYSLSFMYRPNYVNGISASFGNPAKIIAFERSFPSESYDSNSMMGMISKKLISITYNKADLVVTNSKRTVIDLKDNFNISSKITTIYNPIPIDKYLGKANGKVKENEYFTFVNIANLFEYKNQDLIIKAFAKLEGASLRLVIVGEGENRENLTQLIKELKQENRIELVGHQTNTEDYLREADCFVLSSNREGFPNVLLEALTFSLPIISTDCLSGPRELLAPDSPIEKQILDEMEIAEYGILVPVNHTALMYKAMDTIYNNQKMRIDFKEKALKRARMFDTDIIMEHFRNEIIKA